MIVRLALKNLWRNPRRSGLTALSLIVGIGVFVVGDAFLGGLDENTIAAAENGTVGSLLARPAGYPTIGVHAPLDKLVTVGPEARALLDREAVAWTTRVLFTPTAVHGADAVRVRATGYEPARDAKVFTRERWVVQGAEPAADGDELTISPSVARILGLKVGDRFVLQARTHQGALNALEVRVAAIVQTGNLATDSLGVRVPMPLAARLTGAEAPTHVLVKLARRGDAKAFKPALAAALGPQAEVATLEEETAELLALQAVRRKMLDVVVFILLALAAFGVANTFLMAAHERTREVGTLRALGMTEGRVAALFVTEGALVGLAASLLGVAWGGWLSWWWSVHPIDFTKEIALKTNGTVAMSPLLGTRFSPAVLVFAVVLGVVVAVAASWYPARVASALRPADAVRA